MRIINNSFRATMLAAAGEITVADWHFCLCEHRSSEFTVTVEIVQLESVEKSVGEGVPVPMQRRQLCQL